MEIRELHSVDEVSAADWNALEGTQCPFLRHEFLAALEHTGCVGTGTGWIPAHLALFEAGHLRAAAPAYRKQHSWGEFVFDHGWAQAYARYGLSYYPKLLVAVPFSPINSSRLLISPGKDFTVLQDALVTDLEQRCAAQELSSAHATFLSDKDREAFTRRGWLMRSDVQFHWHNAGYADFETYLATFRSEKRKQMRRERRRISEAGLTISTLRGSTLDESTLDFAHAVHARTFHAHGHEPYLNRKCFGQIAQTLGDAMVIKLARHAGKPVAAAVFFADCEALYGRYWGALGEFHSLHFELCYHQGIEFCIEQRLSRFEPGTQGEHKIARGFVPCHTRSAHYIADPRFREAIADFLQREAAHVEAYAEATAAHTPFHRE